MITACFELCTDMFGRPGGIRTPNPRIWSPVLYQLELLACGFHFGALDTYSVICPESVAAAPLFGFPVGGVPPAVSAVLTELQFIRCSAFVLRSGVVAPFTLGTG